MFKCTKIIAVLFFILSGCFTDVAMTKGMRSGQVQLGASKEGVALAVGYPFRNCVKTRIRADGNYEMWDYASQGCAFNLAEGYALIFRNDELIEIRTVHSFLDLQF
jgi:hypothetical protein